MQGYTKLLHVLGSNLAEFLQNLNNLHLHLSMGWPSMVAPGFRCEQVGASSSQPRLYIQPCSGRSNSTGAAAGAAAAAASATTHRHVAGWRQQHGLHGPDPTTLSGRV
jgi:hypothetical protein